MTPPPKLTMYERELAHDIDHIEWLREWAELDRERDPVWARSARARIARVERLTIDEQLDLLERAKMERLAEERGAPSLDPLALLPQRDSGILRNAILFGAIGVKSRR